MLRAHCHISRGHCHSEIQNVHTLSVKLAVRTPIDDEEAEVNWNRCCSVLQQQKRVTFKQKEEDVPQRGVIVMREHESLQPSAHDICRLRGPSSP
jgi:hypothetical protein